jgi:subtilisin-like proprotein convertase family protein
MKSFSFSELSNKLSRRSPKSDAAAQRAKAEKLILEELENRTLLSVLPAPTVSVPQNLSETLTAGQSIEGFFPGLPSTGANPQTAADPTNHNYVVEFNNFSLADEQFVSPPAPFNDLANSFLEGRFSFDGGKTWTLITSQNSSGLISGSGTGTNQLGMLLGNLEDPAATTPTNIVQYTTVSAPSVAFDSNHDFFVIFTESNSSGTSGAVVLSEYTLHPPTQNQFTPVSIVYEDRILYQWSGSDAAYNPTIAVDTNQASFTDPQTSKTQTDPLAGKAVFVAWNENQTEPGSPVPPQVSTIVVQGSGDDGQTFSPSEYVSGTGAAPEILITQGTATANGQTPRVPGGDLIFVWNGSEEEDVGGTVQWVYDEIVANEDQVPLPSEHSYAAFLSGPTSAPGNLNPATAGANSLARLSQSNLPVAPGTTTVTAGSSLGTVVGDFYGAFLSNGQLNSNEQGDDLATITQSSSGRYFISTLQVDDGIVLPSSANQSTELPANIKPIAFVAGAFVDGSNNVAGQGFGGTNGLDQLAILEQDTTSGNYFFSIYSISSTAGLFNANPNASQNYQLAAGFTPTAITEGIFEPATTPHIDLAIAGYSTTQGGLVEIFHGDGQGDFGNGAAMPLPNATVVTSTTPLNSKPVSITVGSFNPKDNSNDATNQSTGAAIATPFLDLAVVNVGLNGGPATVDILTNHVINDTGTGTFDPPTAVNELQLPANSTPKLILSADFNNTTAANTNAILKTTTTMNISDVAILYATGAGAVAVSNGDGTWVTNLNNTNTPFSNFSGPSSAVTMAVGDFNKDGFVDIVTSDNDGDLTVFAGASNVTFSAHQISPSGMGNNGVTGVASLATTNPNSTGNNGPIASFNPNAPLDFNNDGFNDLYVISPDSNTNVSIYEGNPGTITPGVTNFNFSVNLSDPNFSLSDLSVNLGLIEQNLNGVEVQLVPPQSVITAVQNAISSTAGHPYVGYSFDGFILVDSTVTVGGDKTANLSVGGANLGELGYVGPTNNGSDFFNPTGPSIFDTNSGQLINDTGGTVFDVNALREIQDTTTSAPYIGVYQPAEDDPFAAIILPPGQGQINVPPSLKIALALGLTPAQLDGQWSIKITDFNEPPSSNPPANILSGYGVTFSGDLSTTGFGTTNLVASGKFRDGANIPYAGEPLAGNFNDNYPNSVTTDSGPVGIGPGIAIAVDNTLGAFSPYQGRIYIAYNGYGNLEEMGATGEPATQSSPDVYLMYSDDGGNTWAHQPDGAATNPANLDPVTDDSANTNFSEGNRPKFDASLEVDPATGTLVVSYYDGRFDPANVNVVNTIQVSIDGGQTWSSGSFLNELNDAADFFTGSVETIEPIPGNANSSAIGFGQRPDSILVYDGQVTVVFTSNLNSTYAEQTSSVAGFAQFGLTTGASIFSTSATFQAGPAVISADQGPVTQDGSITINGHTYTYNTHFVTSSNVSGEVIGTRELDGFVVQFDRPVDPLTFTTAQVTIMYRSPTTPAGSAGTIIPASAVVPLDEGANFGPGLPTGNPLATTFLVQMAPQFLVGTYSYSVGPLVYDRIRSKQGNGNTVNGNPMDQNDNGVAGEDSASESDAFATPKPLNGIPFELPYDPNTEPLIIPGPHVVYTYLPTATPPTISQVDAIENGTIPQTDNVSVDGSVSSIIILFDRNMNAASITPASILSLIGPDGPITSGYVITPDPAGTDPQLAQRTFEITFVNATNHALLNPQVLSGTYTVQFAATALDTAGEAVDTNLNAGLDVLEGANPSSSNTTITTYSNNAALTIVPGQTVFSTINVADSYSILQDIASGNDIQVQLNIAYPTDADLNLALIAPDGTTIQLFNGEGVLNGAQSGFEDTIFDDGAATPIGSGSPPFDVGPFQPAQVLSALSGRNSFGQWRLAITDTNSNPAAGTKQLISWSLKLPHATTSTSSYTNSTAVTILPGRTVVSKITVSDSYQIEQDLANHDDIQVQLNILYPTDTDLQAELISPNGTIIPLFTNVGQFGSGNGKSGFENTIFDDGASAPIELAGVPFDTGPFNPQKPLSALVGEGSMGVWQLAITDTNSNPAAGTKELTYWTLTLPHSVPGTGLGEPVADQYNASFRIFTQEANNATAYDSYTAIGPASSNGLLYDNVTKQYDIVSPNADAGQVNAIAVDPSDPSGNTVYVGGGNGGVWKTTNFMTTSPNGPTWIPLTNLGPTNSLNISGLAIAGVNADPNQSIIFAITGNSDLYGQAGFPNNPTTVGGAPGVGLLRSEDGGKTWEVLDGLNNVDSNGNILPMQSALRDHTFAGDVGFKVIVDPHPVATGFIVYAAFSGPSGGLYRSVNSGNTWTLIKAGNATDVVLAPASIDANGNMETLYAGFQSSPAGGSGVFMTTSARTTTSLNLMGGGQGVNVRVVNGTNQPVPVTNDGVNPNGQGGRIVLATPALTNNPLENIFYQQYVYAAVVNSTGSTVDLFMTKDAGNNWTQVGLSTFTDPVTGQVDSQYFQDPYGTNNTNDPNYDVAGHPGALGQGNYDVALAIDPTNPNVVYLGGTDTSFFAGENVDANSPSNGLIRIDTSKMLDTYAEVGYLNDSPSGALQYNGANGSEVVNVPGDNFQYAPGSATTANAPTDGFSYGIKDAYNTNPYPLPEYTPIAPATVTKYSNSTPVTIQAGQTVTSTISISDSYLILQSLLTNNDIQLQLNINYPSDQDLQATLIAPDGTQIPLFANVGGTGSNFSNTVFDDGASAPITLGTAPFNGSYRPQAPLQVLNNTSAFGNWTLQITDTNANVTGGPFQLTNWSLSFPHATTTSNYLNFFRDPNHPFVNPSSLQMINIKSFNNVGTGAIYSGFNYFIDNSTNFHVLLATVDPTTGQPRLILGDDQGVFTGLDNGSGGANPGITGPGINGGAVPAQTADNEDVAGTQDGVAISGTRNGNLQLDQFNASSAQPSTLAADVADALYYGTGAWTGSPQSTSSILTTGDITWQTTYGAYRNLSTSFSTSFPGYGQDIATDASGTGTLYQFRRPGSIDQLPFVPTDFFEVTPVVNGNQLESITSRTTGLLQAGDVPANLGTTGQWGNQQGFNFAVNPIDPSGLVASSNNGDIFRSFGPTTGYGVQWFQIATGGELDGSNAQALSFGAPQTNNPNALDDFIYAGTADGHIYVTFNGGGAWTNISAGLDGSAVEQIVTDPTRGSKDAYAVTLGGVYYMANASAPNATWVKLDDTAGQGGLFSLTRGNFGNTSDPIQTLKYLTSIAVDWRYAIPNSSGGGTHPVLYVAGNGGVFRSLDQGKTWTYYPDVTSDGAVAEGGNLPNATVTSLTLVLGDVNPATGFVDPSTGLNQLVVGTYGQGDFAIRLDGNAKVNGVSISHYLTQPNPGPTAVTVTEVIPNPGSALTGLQIHFSGPIDPQSFTSAAITLLSGPNGPITLGQIQNVTPAPVSGQGDPASVIQVNFATPQTTTGNYSIGINQDVTDFSGNPLTAPFSSTVFFTPDTPPTITPVPTNEPPIPPGSSFQISFTISSAKYLASQLTVAATSDNTNVIPYVSTNNSGGLVLTHNGALYTLTISPPALNPSNQTNTGEADVSITVTDPQNNPGVFTFPVIVDEPPQLAPTASLTQLPNAFPYNYTIGATSPLGLTLSYSATTRGDSLLYDVQSQYLFQGVGYFTFGATAYVLHSNQTGTGVGGYYLLRPSDGALFPYDGSGSYAHTFANSSPITLPNGKSAILGANTYTDPGLLLNAQPPADYVTLNNTETQYQFQGLGYLTAGATAYVLKAASNNTFNNPYYLISASGGLYAYDGSGSYSHTFSTTTPVAILGSTIYTNPNELLDSVASPSVYAQLYQLNSTYDLQEFMGSFYTNTYGNQAQWIYSPVLNQYGQHWYTLILNTGGTTATLRAWEGYQDSSVGNPIATLPASVYNNPALLTNATYLPNPAVTTSINQSTGVLTIGLPTNTYVGTFDVVITATDGLVPVTQLLTVTSADNTPSATIQQGVNSVPAGSTQPFTHGSLSNGVTFTVTPSGGETGPANDTVSATVSSYSQPFSLEQQYQFKGVGFLTAGAPAYVLTAVGNNSFGNQYYLISTTGGIYAYDGSGSYAHTFANVTPIATLGSNYYNDPTLLLNAQPAVNYSTLFTEQSTFQFQGLGYINAGALAYVLKASSNNSFGNPYYLLAPNGGLYAYDGSGSYAHTYANVPTTAVFDPGVYVNPALLLTARVAPAMYPQLYQAEVQEFDLQEYQNSFYTGTFGNQAKWLYSPILNSHSQHWYTLVLSANGSQALLYAYDGGTNSIPNGAQPVATFDPSIYYDPTLLLNAKAPLAESGATVTPGSGTQTVTSPTGFVGTELVTVSVTDGITTTNQSFIINSTDTAPVPNTIPPQTASASGSPLMVTLSSTDAENDTPNYSAAAVGYSPAYNLQQIYQFTGVGYLTNNGVTAYVLHSNVLGAVGGYYLLTSSGALYAYDGSGNYSETVNNAANLVANLSPSVYTSPSLLTNAQPPVAPAAVVSVNGTTLSVNVSSVAPGTVFQVVVSVNDGAETTTTRFLVTVTA